LRRLTRSMRKSTTLVPRPAPTTATSSSTRRRKRARAVGSSRLPAAYWLTFALRAPVFALGRRRLAVRRRCGGGDASRQRGRIGDQRRALPHRARQPPQSSALRTKVAELQTIRDALAAADGPQRPGEARSAPSGVRRAHLFPRRSVPCAATAGGRLCGHRGAVARAAGSGNRDPLRASTATPVRARGRRRYAVLDRRVRAAASACRGIADAPMRGRCWC